MVRVFFGGEWQNWAFAVTQRHIPLPTALCLYMSVKQQTLKKKKKRRPVKTMNSCQKTRNLTYRATVVRQSRDRLAGSPRRSVLSIAHRERWQSPLPGSTAATLSPITNTEGPFLTATTSDAGNKTLTRERTLSKLARPSSLSSKRSGQENKQAHSL